MNFISEPTYRSFSQRSARFLCLLTLAILTALTPAAVFSRTEPSVHIQTLRNEINKTVSDSIRITKLFDLAFFYSDYLGDDRKADSLGESAIRLAEMSYRPELILFALNRYIETNNLSVYTDKALVYARKAGKMQSDHDGMEFRTANNLADVYLADYKYDLALENSYKMLSIANSSGNEKWKVESYLDIGESLEGRNQKIEAFRNYLTALSLAERIKDDDLLIRCYTKLSRFYNLNRLPAKATHYKLLQQELIKKKIPLDSVALVWTWYDLQEIELNSGNNSLNEENMRKILGFAVGWKCERLLQYEMAVVRTHLIEADKIDLLYRLYHNQFPGEFARLSSENPGLFARLKAYFAELENRNDSALFFFNKAGAFIELHPNKILQSNFYFRYGQFLARQGMTDPAIEKFSKSYEKASEASFFDYMLSASKQLESIYAGKKDFENAYRYALLNKVLSDSLVNLSKNDQMLAMEIEHEARQRELNAEMEKQEVDRQHYLQYSAIIIIIISLFIILLMLGSLKVPEWIIRMLGFFSFIFLFEFIILIADHKIHDITHGEPWKILIIKIFLIGILLPMHHWIEKRVIAFLLNPGLVNIARYPLRSKLREQITRVRSARSK